MGAQLGALGRLSGGCRRDRRPNRPLRRTALVEVAARRHRALQRRARVACLAHACRPEPRGGGSRSGGLCGSASQRRHVLRGLGRDAGCGDRRRAPPRRHSRRLERRASEPLERPRGSGSARLRDRAAAAVRLRRTVRRGRRRLRGVHARPARRRRRLRPRARDRALDVARIRHRAPSPDAPRIGRGPHQAAAGPSTRGAVSSSSSPSARWPSRWCCSATRSRGHDGSSVRSRSCWSRSSRS